MTRINVIPPSELTDPHLRAEYRELPRIFGLVRRHVEAGRTPTDLTIPDQYLLGRGHMLFFYNKLGFLLDRQRALIAEMKARGYKPQFTRPETLIEGIPEAWRQPYEPTPAAQRLNRYRIQERLRA